jgi:predicted PurR-regulated permease PerM
VGRFDGLGRGLKLSTIAVPFLAVMAAAAFFYFARPVLVPLATAATITYLLAPAVDFLTRRGLSRGLAVTAVLVVALSLFVGIGYVLLGEAYDLATRTPQYLQSLQTLLGEWREKLPPTFANALPASVDEVWQSLDLKDIAIVPKTFLSGLGWTLSLLVWCAMVAILAVFMLLDQPAMYRRIVRVMGADQESQVRETLQNINRQLEQFLIVRFGISAVLAVVVTIGLMILGVPYSYIWGPLTGLLNVVPYFGAILAAVPPIIVAMVDAGSLMAGVWVALFFLVVQFIEGNVVAPKIMGDRVSLNVVAVLAATLVWGWLWGPIGVLLAVPITAAMKLVCERIEPLRPIAVLLG